jgi:hypothetical protein
MARHTSAPQTIEFLKQTGGADWETIALHFGLTRIAVTARIKAARRYLTEQGMDKTIPRPTVGTGWLYQVTDKMYAQPTETSIGRSSVMDLQMVTAVARRLVNDGYVAWDAIPKGQRNTRAARSIRTFIGAMENAASVCESERKVLQTALRQLP